MSIQTTVTPARACIDLSSVFQNPLLEDAAAPATATQRRQQQLLQARAERACLECPMMQRCLYVAVVEHDVAGYVAGTTQRQRQEIRRHLGITVQPEDLDTFAGVTSANRQIDPREVARMRAANPHESLETIAQRLGCSLSTVKRHLRKARALAEQPELHVVKPSLEQVLHATRLVVGGRERTRVAA